MSYESCAASAICTIRGIATAKLGEHAPTVELLLGDGRCVNVSFPRERWAQLKLLGPREMVITGRVYQEPPNEDGRESIMKINGRTIGLGLCGNFFLFVK
jgi:hypothetical protein